MYPKLEGRRDSTQQPDGSNPRTHGKLLEDAYGVPGRSTPFFEASGVSFPASQTNERQDPQATCIRLINKLASNNIGEKQNALRALVDLGKSDGRRVLPILEQIYRTQRGDREQHSRLGRAIVAIFEQDSNEGLLKEALQPIHRLSVLLSDKLARLENT